MISTLTYPDGSAVNYEWDAGGHLITLTDSTAGAIHYHYDTVGNLITRNLPNGIVTQYTYDSAYRIASIQHTLNNNLILGFAYTYDSMGNCLTMTRTEGSGLPQKTEYKYDGDSRLVQVTYPDGEVVTYAYDTSGNRLSKSSSHGTTTRYSYNGFGQLIEMDAGQDATKFVYSPNGDLTERHNPDGSTILYTWDDANQLVSVTTNNNTVALGYDGDRRRLFKDVNGQRVEYLEHGSDLPQVMAVINGQTSTRLIPGLPHSGEISGQASRFYLEDALGSVVGITDASGALISSPQFDAFGVPRGTPAMFGFAGEQFDIETGLLFLRARYYDPALGRFISPDLLAGSPLTPQSLNRYSYATNNPILSTDPTGLQAGIPGQTALTGFEPPPPPFPPRQYDQLWNQLGVRTQELSPVGDPVASTTYRRAGWQIGIEVPFVKVVQAGLTLPNGGPLTLSAGLGWENVQGPTATVSIGLPALLRYGLALGWGKITAPAVSNPTFSWSPTISNLLQDRNVIAPSDVIPFVPLPYWEGQNTRVPTLNGLTGTEMTDALLNAASPPSLSDQPKSGLLGGVDLDKVAQVLVNLNDIQGATFDQQTGQLVLIGSQISHSRLSA